MKMDNLISDLKRFRERAADIRVIATDIDGTLLDGNSSLTERTIKAINALGEKGIGFTICTGREYGICGLMFSVLKPKLPVVCSDGGEVVDPLDGRAIFHNPLPKEESAPFIRLCTELGLDFGLTSYDGAYFSPGSKIKTVYEFYSDRAKEAGAGFLPMYTIGDAEELMSLEHNKVILRRDHPNFPKALEYLEKHCPGSEYTYSGQMLADVVRRGSSKGEGLRIAAEAVGLQPSQFCVFGDSMNDVPMFQFAGLSFAMDNASDEVKAAADGIAPSNAQDGVAQVIEALFL